MKTYVLLVVMIFFGSLGDVLLGKGMKQIGEVSGWSLSALAGVGAKTIMSGTIWLGVVSLLTFFVSYLLVLSWADYSFVSPASSMSYAIVPVLGYLMLDEVLSPLRWMGVGLIFLGVVLVSRTPHSTTAKEEVCVPQ
ncbi:MAG: EamA family transporter [Planctomycetes bacterium]|nr:EamA family transporter [Planctomycetota bacterium]